MLKRKEIAEQGSRLRCPSRKNFYQEEDKEGNPLLTWVEEGQISAHKKEGRHFPREKSPHNWLYME